MRPRVISYGVGLTRENGVRAGGQMSQRNGDKSRFQINRKRAVLRRAKIRALVAAASAAAAPAEDAQAPKAGQAGQALTAEA